MDAGHSVRVRFSVKDHRPKTGSEDLDHYLGISDHLSLRAAADHKADRDAVSALKLCVAEKFDTEFLVGRAFLAGQFADDSDCVRRQ